MATTDNRFSLTDPTGWMQMWASLWRGVPEHLVQPINQGWFGTSFLINSNNSSAPQTEMDVVAKYSYGRQINRIDKLKLESAGARVEQVTIDLALLKERDKELYTRVRDALREALREALK